MQTVRTIADKNNGLDRATINRLQRIAPDKIAKALQQGDRRAASAHQH